MLICSLRMRKLLLIILPLLIVAAPACTKKDANRIRIGLIAEITGDMPAVGASSSNAATMAVEEINHAGGIEIQGRRYPVDLLIQDNAGRPEQAAAVAQRLIAEDKVDALVGPNASRYTVPVAEIAESAKVPMITPWATNPKVTVDARSGKPKKYVFRACFTDPFQGKVVANFARADLRAAKAAVLYDVASDYNKGIAEVFQRAFAESGGTVVAYETYTTGDKDFSAQLTKIKEAAPDVIFLPNYYTEIPLQIQQAKRLGIREPFLGSDSWGSEELTRLCGADCEGYYFTTHYAAGRPSEEAARFIEGYKAKYQQVPDDPGALTYDAFGLLFRAIAEAQSTDRQAIRDALAGTKDYRGVTGRMLYAGSGDPVKSVVVVQIRNGRFDWFADVNP